MDLSPTVGLVRVGGGYPTTSTATVRSVDRRASVRPCLRRPTVRRIDGHPSGRVCGDQPFDGSTVDNSTGRPTSVRRDGQHRPDFD